jgi:hypothetical protein
MTRSGEDDKLIMTEDLIGSEEAMTRRGHRAIGVVYDPAVERYGNYVPSILPLRYDMFLHIDETRALNPLHLRQITDHEPPETYPWGI